MAGGVNEDLPKDRPFRFCCVLMASNSEDSTIVHNDIFNIGIQKCGNVLFHMDLFPDDHIKDGKIRIRITTLVFQQYFLDDSGFTKIGLGGMTICADNMHSCFGTSGSTKDRTVLNQSHTDASRAAAIAAQTPAKPPPVTTTSKVPDFLLIAILYPFPNSVSMKVLCGRMTVSNQ